MEKRILALDSQILDAIQKCNFYVFLAFLNNYRPNGDIKLDGKPHAMERGSLGHELLEVYYKLLQRGISWDRAVESAIIHGRDYYQKLQLDLSTSEWVITTFQQYAEYYQYDGLEVLGVEESFAMPIYEDEELILIYQGKIDLHCKMPNLGESCYDHKFRAMKANYTPLDNQLIGYSIKTGSNLLYVNEIGMQKSYEPKVKFRRIPIPIADGLKERWLKNTIQWGKILDHCIQTNTWPQSHLKVAPQGISQCEKCQFQRICKAGNDDEMGKIIREEFHIVAPWDVGNNLEENIAE